MARAGMSAETNVKRALTHPAPASSFAVTL
jgi:hypothetical protein